jgi:hypothetical protein
MNPKDYKEDLIFFGIILIVLILLVATYLSITTEQEIFIEERHCVMIHENPAYRSLQWNGVVMVPLHRPGERFYKCDGDVWKQW